MNMKSKIILFSLFFAIMGKYAAFSSSETIYMNVGDTRTLAPVELTSKVLAGQPAWTSSRPNDVQIVSTSMYTCKIKALKSFTGYAIVHCLYYFQELDPTTGKYIYQRSGYVDYNVLVEGNTEPQSITLYPEEVTMSQGDTRIMKVSVSPSDADQTVQWFSTDRYVATVNANNVLGANGYGTATVTAMTVNGLTASCLVTVREPSVAPKSVSLPETAETRVGGTITLTPTVSPSNATTTFVWKTDNASVATVSNGTVKGVGAGETTIRVTTGNGLSASCIVTVKSDPSGVDYDESKVKQAKSRIQSLRNKSMNHLSEL